MAISPFATGYSASSRGLSGLVSGMDTQSMVEKMLSGTKAKIDKQNSIRQQLLWKQDIYRDVISNLRNFQLNFFSFSKPESNLISSSFFNNMSAVYKSDAVKISATNDAATGKFTIDNIKQLATAYKEESTHQVTANLSGVIDSNVFNEFKNIKREVTIQVGSTSGTISFTANEFAGKTSQEIVDSINSRIVATGLNGKVAASLVDGKLVFQAQAGYEKETVQVDGSAEGLEVLGLKNNQFGTGSVSAINKIDLSKANPKINIVLDGVEKTIVLSDEVVAGAVENTKEAYIAKNLENSIKEAFGNGITVSFNTTDKSIEIGTIAGEGRQVTIGGSNSSILGLKSGQSNKINLNMRLADINFGQQLQGSTYRFTINGTTLEASSNDTLSSVINRINSSQAGVTVSYSSLKNSFTIESKTMGAGIGIEMKNDVGNLLSSMFGVGSSGSAVSMALKNEKIYAENATAFTDIKSGDFKVTVNGTAVAISLPEKTDKTDYTAQEAVDYINAELEKRAGVDANGNANIKLGLNGSQVTLTASKGYNVEFSAENAGSSITTALGFTADQNQRATDTTLMSDLGMTSGIIQIGTQTIDLSSYTTFADFKAGLTAALGSNGTIVFDENMGTLGIMSVSASNFSVTGTDAAGKAAMEKLFGSGSMEFNSTAVATAKAAGQNAVLSVNGTEIVRNSNNFTIDGLNIELTNTFNAVPKLDTDGKPIIGTDGKPVFEIDPSQKIDVNTTRNTEQIYKGIESFVTEYNKLVEKLNGLIDAPADYKQYPPLTAEQKKEMSEKEIELWEEKAKSGLVRKDDIISGLLSDMRMSLYQKPDSASMALYEIGITTSTNWKDKGQLVISDPEAFKFALASNPEQVQELFTNAENGLAKQLNNIIDKTAKASSGSPGSLVALAGIKGAQFDKTSSLDKQLKSIDDRISNLKRTYEKEHARYWKQFNAMEKMVASMNQQSSWLSQQFS